MIFKYVFLINLQIKVEARADLSLDDGSSIDISSGLEKSNNAADEINLNSDDDEFKDEILNAAAGTRLDLSRTEPEDIFEDIPETRDVKVEAPITPSVFEPANMNSQPIQVLFIFMIYNKKCIKSMLYVSRITTIPTIPLQTLKRRDPCLIPRQIW